MSAPGPSDAAAATAELEEAARRRAEIERQKSIIVAELAQRKLQRKSMNGGRGSGRMNGTEQRKEDRLNAMLKRLNDNLLPGEKPSARDLGSQSARVESIRANAQHHADALPPPPGRARPADQGAARLFGSTVGEL